MNYKDYVFLPHEAVFVIVACTISCLSCGWLLIRLGRLVQDVQGYLFPRQLWHLALANLIMHAIVLSQAIVAFIRGWENAHTSSVEQISCHALDPLFRYGRCVSVLIQFLIGATFAAQGHLRWTLLVTRCMRLVWCVGLVFAAMDTIESKYLRKANDFGICPDRPHATWTSVLLMTCVYFAIISWTAWVAVPRAYCGERASSSKLVENLRRAVAFAVCFPIAYFPMIVGFAPLHLFNEFTENTTWYFSLEYTMEALSGAMNCATYAYQSRYARVLFRTRSILHRAQSAHLHMPGRVGFAGVDIIEVLPLTERALWRAEQETARLEDKGFNGMWRTGSKQEMYIQGTTVHCNDAESCELEIYGQEIKLVIQENIYWGDVVEEGEAIRWSDGDVWRRFKKPNYARMDSPVSPLKTVFDSVNAFKSCLSIPIETEMTPATSDSRIALAAI